MTGADLFRLLVAALGGAAVGLERQRSGHADGPAARFAGLRTFTLLGALAGLTGWLWVEGAGGLAAVLLAGAVGMTVTAYIAASRADVDGTTEVAALVVLAAGVLAGMGYVRVASGLYALIVLLLVEKTRLHDLVRRVDDVELRAGVRFAVMALVVLPLLPEGPFGPLGGIRPRALWLLVLFFSGLSFAGDLLRGLVGSGRGYLVAGALGGVASSTNVTFTFARLSRRQPDAARELAFGAIGANAMLYPRVLLATAVLNAPLVAVLAPLLAAPALTAIVMTALGSRRRPAADGEVPLAVRRPLQLSAALQMAALFQIVIFIVNAARQFWGAAGVLTTAAVLGLTDVDALTLSMAREVAGPASLETAAAAIAVGVVANTVLKMTVAMTLGGRPFRLIVGLTLATMVVLGAASIVLLS